MRLSIVMFKLPLRVAQAWCTFDVHISFSICLDIDGLPQECLDRNEFEAAVNYAHILQSSQDLSSASKTVKPSVKEIGTLDFDMSAQLCIEAVITRLKEKLDDAMVLRYNTSASDVKLIRKFAF